MRTAFIATIILLLGGSATWAADATELSNRWTRIRVTDGPGGATGFAVATGDGRELCTVSLGPKGLWAARQADVRDGSTLRFGDLSTDGSGGTPRLGPESFVEVELGDESRWPRVRFVLDLVSFDHEAWELALDGPCPLHYLVCRMPEAALFYQGGALIPSPALDPYPLSRPNMSGAWAPGWSYAPPMAAYAIPAVGLWRPDASLFVAYDFDDATLTDHSVRSIASAYHAPESSFCLVHPYQRRWTELTYPECPSHVDSHMDLVYSTDIPDRRDPNEFILRRVFAEMGDKLPPVPSMNDLGWIPDYDGWTQAPGLPRTGFGASLIHPSQPMGLEGYFVEPGATMLGNNFAGEGVEAAYERGDRAAIDQLRAELELLMARAERFEVDGDPCVAWNHPLDGRFQERWGGDGARGLHHESTFEIGAAFLIVYKHERDAKYLPIIDGIFNWCRHYAWTRNGVCDLAWAMFSRTPTAVSENFLLNYHALFRDDPERGAQAEEAIDLAVASLYKTLWVYLTDPDPSDSLDPTFLTQAVNDRWWIGQVTWNECGWFVRSLVPMYCETGDPNLQYLLRGILERYFVGQLEDGYNYCEDLDILGEWNDKGKRSASFDPCHAGSVRRWALPPGATRMRVVMGEKAAIAFCKGTRDSDIDDYAFNNAPGFRFRVVSSFDGPFDLVASAPFRDLRGLPVLVNGRPCDPARVEFNPSTSGEDVCIRGVRDGDVVVIGREPDGPALHLPRIDEREPGGHGSGSVPGFVTVDLHEEANADIDARWTADAPWRGLTPGRRYLDGVPYDVVDPAVCEGKGAVRSGSVASDVRGDAAFLLVGRAAPGDPWPRVTVRSGGVETLVDSDDYLPADIVNGWRPHSWEVARAGVPLGGQRAQVEVQGGLLLALSIATTRESAGAGLERLRVLADGIDRETKQAVATESALDAAAARVRASFGGQTCRVALLPPHRDLVKYGNTFQAETERRVAAAATGLGLQPAGVSAYELIDPTRFSADLFPIAVYISGEEYIRTVKEREDGAEALRRYVREGGILLSLSTEATFPFAYPIDRVVDEWVTGPLGIDPAGSGRAVFGASLGCNVTFREGRGWEQPPAGVDLHFRPMERRDVLPGFPADMPFPPGGDRRWRSVADNGLPEGATLEPLVGLYDADGRFYGAGAALTRLPGGGMVGFVFGRLLDPPLGDALMTEMLAAVAGEVPAARRIEPVATPEAAAATPTAPPEGSLLVDGSLEERGRYYAMQPMDAWCDYDPHSGRFCADLSIDHPGSNCVLLTTPAQSVRMGLEPNTRYRVRFWAKTVSGQGFVRVNFYAGQGCDFPQVPVELTSDGQWHPYEVEVTTGRFERADMGRSVFAPSGVVMPSLRIFSIERRQRTFVDDISLEPI